MPKTDRKARHYVGNTSEINLGKNNYYGLHEKNHGPGSENKSGALKKLSIDEQTRRNKNENEIAEAVAIRESLRSKKKDRGRKRAEKRISNVIARCNRGEISIEQRDYLISEIKRKNREAELRNGAMK